MHPGVADDAEREVGSVLLRVVAVADPDAEARDRIGDLCGVAPERRYASWRELLATGKLADRWGRKRLFLIGVAVFVAASAWAGARPCAMTSCCS